MWIWFNDRNVMLFFAFFLLESGSTLQKLTCFLAQEQLVLFLCSYETPSAKTKPFLKLSVFASLQTN